MTHQDDTGLIREFILRCSRSHMTLNEMARTVGRSRGWASLLINGKITRLQFGTRSRLQKFLGEI
jgi:plasmid maintenance system antidote protein VapI